MATIDVSSCRVELIKNEIILSQLPPDLLQIISSQTSLNFLDGVAAAALIPQLTIPVFISCEHIFADICARWLLRPRHESQEDQIIAAFARILPFAPHLSVYLEKYISETSPAQSHGSRPFTLSSLNSPTAHTLPPSSLLQALLAFWRLLNFDKGTYGTLVLPSHIQALFDHELPQVRYLAVKVFCCHMSASDVKEEALIFKYVYHGSTEPIPLPGDFDGREVEYNFLSLFERKRAMDIETSRHKIEAEPAILSSSSAFPPQRLTDLVIKYGNIVLPRPDGSPLSQSRLISTPTTLANLESLAQNLQKAGPILLHGLAGSGKTSAVHELARELGMESDMVTLHLNEQTDAKMLIGLYSTDSKPGSFSWRPGVLTTAVREGRWVLIEDLDKAPNEVMSTLLPLVEHGKLLIPSRGETIEASSTFQLFATVRTTKGMHGQENLPNFLGHRFWHMSSTRTPPYTELQQIIIGSYPLLHKYAPDIILIYKRLCAASSATGTGRGAADRPITPRDLLKWCRRLTEILIAAGCKTGEEPITDTTRNWMFMEAIDCFCGSLSNQDAKGKFVSCIAEEMHLPKQLMEHYLKAHVPQLDDTPTSFRVGRVMLTKRRYANRITKSKKPFASTGHAKRLLEQIATAVKLREPVLLVGETGIGKTTVVQQLAETLGHKLVAVNLSQQSEVGDLLGGFKPVDARSLAVPLKEEFEDLFAATGISAAKNQKYLEQIGKCTAKGQWTRVLKLWREAPKMFMNIVEGLQAKSETREVDSDGRPVVKRRKTESKLQSLLDLKPRWESFSKNLDQFDIQISGGSGNFAFAFVEGNIVKAARNGDWVLLDEINLASPDTLESIADLLASGPHDEPSILLSETGEIERVKAHPDFRIFGAMNPATDIGKKDLPIGLRSRFTELYVGSPDKDQKDLLTIIKAYLAGRSEKDDKAADDIARLYLNTKQRAEEKRLVDGANEVPHFSLRTLTRVLTYVNDVAPLYGLTRALFEGFSMGFLTLLDKASEDLLVPLIHHHLLERHGNARSLLSQPPKHPTDGKQYVKFVNRNKDRHYWLLQGGETPIERSDYIITPYIERNLLNLVRATSTRRFPILIQGPTSAGKTSMIEYLANYSGNKFVRINNHEHTDLQEYLGTYISDSTGKLRFQEGLLVQALRQGHWIVLDELNLAPTDVLEALNRLLDDNRELLIPETQQIVRPHENFVLFATQNPPGLYGGRKVLSRAFRNRFLELHFDDIPEDELETILQKRSVYTAPSDCKRIVNVYKELSRLRQTSRLFENKDSFATLRDLFRWALRSAESRDEIAANGFMLLAERVRNEEERQAVKKVIETVFKVKIDQDRLYDLSRSPYLRMQAPQNGQGVVWTNAMRRLYVLVASALQHNEPVLLVGETGCGKTTVCQLLAESMKKELHIVNAHQNTETGDLIGSQRPIRNRGAISDALLQGLIQAFQLLQGHADGDLDSLLHAYHALDEQSLAKLPVQLRQQISDNEIKSKALFEWADGSLVQAMREGQYFLLDEISLADDSVLERLNSVLEPGRTLLLAEKGIDNSFVKADQSFQFLATMNPGGDFGKKELSPALRNRFTEIWVPPLSGEDILQIISSKLKPEHQAFAKTIVDFSYWFGYNFRSTAAAAFSIRDILVWVKFINESKRHSGVFSVVQGAATVFIDTLGANPSALIAIDPKGMDRQRQRCLDKLTELLGQDATSIYRAPLQLVVEPTAVRIGGFSVARMADNSFETGFALNAPTTKLNAMRVIRALQVQKPILLEGSPGVGKTTLVSALARACGQPLTRINLSDQTDLMDLFGTDVPVEGAEAGHFAWRDAPFLRAMQNGEWVLLDEMNLASQSVLEGLNACLDHRGEVYISELDQVFKRHPDFRLFAAQNPHHQGGGRKGLPSSFVNRFIVVYADVFTDEDLLLIAKHNFPQIPSETVGKIIRFISELESRILVERAFGSQGSPWEFNLRDTLRWLHLLTSSDPLLSTGTVDNFLGIAIQQRFRSIDDKMEVNLLYHEVFGSPSKSHQRYLDIKASAFQIGLASMLRNSISKPSRFPGIDVVARLSELESLVICIKHSLPCILVGPSGCGKSALLQQTAALAGRTLVTFPMNADIDTMDLVGGFEQSDPLREVNIAMKKLEATLELSNLSALPQAVPDAAVNLLNALDGYSLRGTDKAHLLSLIDALQTQISSKSELATLLTEVQNLLNRPTNIDNPRFEWLDGIIVQALQKGDWLVLDNANLCSASVLDRLNSLLEPEGFLIINEHCGADGEPRIVKPHADFRVFLTVDPRYGELSRAMRNRAVEIYVEPKSFATRTWSGRIADVDSRLQRFESAMKLSIMTLLPPGASQIPEISHLAVDGLSYADLIFASMLYNRSNDLTFRISSLTGTIFSPSFTNLVGTVSQHPLTLETQERIQELCNVHLEDASRQAKAFLPLHPLQNSPVVPLLHGYSNQLPFWLAVCYEFSFKIADARKALEQERIRAANVRVSNLNRLQRSFAADQAAAVRKDSTVKSAKFLVGVLDVVESYVRAQLRNPDGYDHNKLVLRDIAHFWNRTFQYLVHTPFEEASFLAHLSHMSDVLNELLSRTEESNTRQLFSHIFAGLEECFVAGFKLSTGLGMEKLWKHLRPIPIPDAQLLSQLSNMESLAAQFDRIKWKSAVGLHDVAKITDSFVQAYRLVRLGDSDVESLLQALQYEIEQMNIKLGDDGDSSPPFFNTEFDTLRQLTTIDRLDRKIEFGAGDKEVVSLSGTPLVTLLRINSATETSKHLQSMDAFVEDGRSSLRWNRSLSSMVLSKLDGIDLAQLSNLATIEAELPVLAKQLGRNSEAITAHRTEKLSGVLWHLITSTIIAYDPELALIFETSREKIENGSISVSISFDNSGLLFKREELPQSISAFLDGTYGNIVEHLLSAFISLIALRERHYREDVYLANAWIQFSLALVKLFVPDKLFDPQLRPLVELTSYDELFKSLDVQLQSLQLYELFQHPHATTFRRDILEKDIRALGDRPAAVQVAYRPTVSELPKIQAEFNSILKVLLDADLNAILFQHYLGSDAATQQLQVIRENVSRISFRLGQNFRAYEDIVVPTINLLRCLEIGLSLGQETTLQRANQKDTLTDLLNIIPFVGGKPDAPILETITSFRHEFLTYAGAIRSIEGAQGVERVQQIVSEMIHAFYEQWHQKLEEDKKAEEVKNSWYRYRGGQDEEEATEQAAFSELFPSYSQDDDGQEAQAQPKIDDARNLAIEVAGLHKNIVLAPQNASQSLKNLVQCVVKKISRTTNNRITDNALLSATLLALDQKTNNLTTGSASTDCNFYLDPNPSESRKLVSLVNDIRAQFRQLQQVDEIGHLQPLADVVSACDKTLEHGYGDSLAKIIPSVERLHAFVHEWQFGGWASKTYGILPLYTRLTDMLIAWRRLELSTWNRLFDLEVKKCDDDAASWWFIAYQAVIVGPMALVQVGENLTDHAVSLIKDLETYFASAPVGQFVGRLKLLNQLHAQLSLLIKEFPQLVIIRDSMRNFINFYSRYENPVTDLIHAGRAPIEKQMKDVVLLASWKDTNIAALRQSAQKTHQKLFKIVRKFRDVLGQSMKIVIDKGLPDADFEAVMSSTAATVDPQIDEMALEVCIKGIPGWAANYKRLANVQRTVQIMVKLSQMPESAVDTAEIIDNFISGLNAQIVELRKETPSTLTEENTDLVKHLKSRKRKLFAEILKTVRQMGIQYNLGLDVLAKQNSLSTVLASTEPLGQSEFPEVQSTEYYFHRLLDLAPKVRRAAQDYSEDLTSAEVMRSIGLFEGIIYNTLGQRRELLKALRDIRSLESSFNLLRSLGQTKNGIEVQKTKQPNASQRTATWLIEILKVGAQIVEIHGKFAQSVNREVLELFTTWQEKFTSALSMLEALPVLPQGFISAERSRVQQELDLYFNQFSISLGQVCEERPDLAFLIEQIRLWSTVDESSSERSSSLIQDITELSQSVKKLCDGILVAVERCNKAGAEFSTSPNDPGWLIKTSDQTAAWMRALHISQVRRRVDDVLSFSQNLDWSNSNIKSLAPSILSIVTPIVNQYENTCNRFIKQAANSHRATCKLGFFLSKNFSLLAAQGFCTPQEKSEEKSGQTDKLEDGTGLGDGEGAEDISKDIQPDEDLSELAQGKNDDPDREMEDEKDAVDMADEDMEGDLNSVDGEEEDEKGSESGDDEEKDEMDEEAGDVDDLDPTAVDEKMWDGENEEEAEKDQKGEKPKGQKKKGEEAAAGDQPETQDLDDDGGDEADDGADQEEEVQQQEEPNQQDQNVPDQEALALPDDMEIDCDDNESMSSISDDELDDLSDIEVQETEEKQADDDDNDNDDVDQQIEREIAESEVKETEDELEQQPEDDDIAMGQDDEPVDHDQGQDQEEPQEEKDSAEMQAADNTNANPDDIAPSDAIGGGQDQDTAEQNEDQENTQNDADQREAGQMGENAPDQDKSEGQKGSVSQNQDRQTETNPEDTESSQSQPFKALGDALEKWHKRQREIKQAQENRSRQPNAEQDTKIQEFQHLEHDDAAADTQAMGVANEEHKQTIDDAMAIDGDEDQPADAQVMPQGEEEMKDNKDSEMDTPEPHNQQASKDEVKEERESGVTTRQGAYNQDTLPPANGTTREENIDDSVQETSTQLLSTHLEPRTELRDFGESMRQWTTFQSKTHPSSLSLTSQLRLILTPSQSTKLSGSYRTGKRLNIKRIIPYIASSYKRDKIWMRRAIPTKRSYQILLCVDDSKSMGESSSGELALESLVMVSRALTMLEVGQIGVMGFGANTFMAHEFSEPFASHDAGAKVLQRFTFQQDYTNIQFLVRSTIDRFRLARQQSTSRGSEDLWQLALILSDGLTPSSEHESIRVLLREAMEERIMIVFIIMDDTTGKGKEQKVAQKQSVLNLKKVRFLGNDEIRTEYYLDSFPFQYYLVVHNLEDLPGALAGLLRTWFAEVNA